MKPHPLLVALALCLAWASTAQARTVPAAAPLKHYENRYLTLYGRVVSKLGADAPGRNLVVDGAAGEAKATPEDIRSSNERMVAMLHPPAPSSSTSTVSSSGGYAIPASIVACESGGDYGAVNPSSGAGGAYQILPSTWASYGGSGAPQDASPAEQDAIAAQIYADSGGGAWVC